ncbi:MAG: alanine racemase [Rhodobacteraceae bacterium]|nr:alanine racemase [Paracoccaceae bacterium]
MSAAELTIDLNAIVANWRALDALSAPEVATAAVVKANGYGLGVAEVAAALARVGARSFFVAMAGEGAVVRRAVGDGAEVFVFAGHMVGDASALRDNALIPLLNSPEQWQRHQADLPGHAFGIQLDTGMNRLGMEAAEWAGLRDHILPAKPGLVMSHLASADAPGDPLNAAQLAEFHAMTEGLNLRRSLAATGGVLLGPDYHFDLCRPGIGLYGGLPFGDACSVLRLSLPLVQVREVRPGEIVGYSGTWEATRPSRIATLAAGYADGLIRAMSGKALVWAGDTACPLVGRVSMDLMAVDVTDLDKVPEAFDILGPHQSVDDLAAAAGTIGYEILTSLGGRYNRVYIGG